VIDPRDARLIDAQRLACHPGRGVFQVCGFILQPDSPKVEKTTIDQIQALHATMQIHDGCVEDLQKQKLAALYCDQISFKLSDSQAGNKLDRG
jgi:hypothetical protein